ncbi:amino acid permease [Caballeronia sp. LP006]|uniref:APC family permease n=1 Tax=Caballeronia sp. LP006 TaxID=3038552 RepID=UPI0028614465|nr:amino acid permease [Caballeronia sp. LP006]MDR5832208.1 amino acid permease [Caballeronia sp. LP006]
MSNQRTEDILREDAATLQRFGYEQELSRRMSAFGNFAVSFMVIGVFFGVSVNMQQGIGSAGMFGLTAMWLVGGVIALATALSLGEISSAIPTAGGLYHWSSVLGGRGWGWATSWINLLAYVFSVGGTAVATYLVFNQMVLTEIFKIDTSQWGYFQQLLGVSVLMLTWAVFNHIGVRTLSRLVEIGAYITFVGATALCGIMLYNIQPANLAHLFDFVNNTGEAGGNVVPHTTNLLLVCGYALLLPMWLVTSYDASAHVSEETVDATRAVPKAMKNSVLFSVILGFVLFVIFGLAMHDPAEIARKGPDGFLRLYEEVVAPQWLKHFVGLSIAISVYMCGASCMTGFSRALYSFARDGGLPKSCAKVSRSFRTPAVAIWSGAVAGVAVTLYSPAFAALTAGTALFYQICYGMAILAAMFARERSYGPFRLGVWSKPCGVVAVVGGMFIVWVGLQPPTEILRHYFVGLFAVLAVGWFGLERRRFPGPPAGMAGTQTRDTTIELREASPDAAK